MGIEKLSSNNVQQVQPQKVPEFKKSQNGDDHPQIRDEQEQQVRISEEAQRLHKQEQASIDQKKVDEIKQAIANKTFRIDAEKIADKMHDEAVEMMKRRIQQAYNIKNGNKDVLGA
jgi:flagellar biosynthesis anti-sigma factor FlgM